MPGTADCLTWTLSQTLLGMCAGLLVSTQSLEERGLGSSHIRIRENSLSAAKQTKISIWCMASSMEEKGRMVHVLKQSNQEQISLYGGIRSSVSLSPSHTGTFSRSLHSGHSSSPSITSQMMLLPRTNDSSQDLGGSETTTAL